MDKVAKFKKAAHDITSMNQLLRKDEVSHCRSTHGITWKFITERASWWVGLWKRLVRTVKISLRKSLGNTYIDSQQLGTLLIESEAVVNSRHLSLFLF